MQARALGLAGVVVLGLLAGCTGGPDEPEVSTAGTLMIEDLGPGAWEGPFPLDKPASGGITYCGWLGQALYHPSPEPVAEATVSWESGEIVVQSAAYYFGDDRAGLEEHIAAADSMETCVRDVGDSPNEPLRFFTWERSGDVFVVRERNGTAGHLWDFDAKMQVVDDTFVGVMVIYPEGTTGHPDVAELLDRAVEAAAELPAPAEEQADDE